MKKLAIIFLWMLSVEMSAQNPIPAPPITDYSINAVDDQVTLYSPNPKFDPNVLEEDMPYFWIPLITSMDNDLIRGGLRATDVGLNGYAEVSIHLYSKEATDGLGTLIYKARTSENTETPGQWVEDPFIVQKISMLNPNETVDVETTNIQQLLIYDGLTDGMKEFYEQSLHFCTAEYLDEYNKTKADFDRSLDRAYKRGIVAGWTAGCAGGAIAGGVAGTMVEPGGGTAVGALGGCILGGGAGIASFLIRDLFGDHSPPNLMQCLQDQLLLPIPPVIIKVTVNNAHLRALKLPTAGEVDLSEYFPIFNVPFELKLGKNGNDLQTIAYPQNENNIPTFDFVMGDELNIELTSDYKGLEPIIYGLPKIWAAPFAGDLMFHCDPNYGPGSINPFIGLDSRVHTLMLRPFPPGYILRESWEESPVYLTDKTRHRFSWTYTAEREMDANLSSYVAPHKWEKKHIKKDGSGILDQRQNQKEGLNMKFLNHWNTWKSSTFMGYNVGTTGKANYMMGFDDDELAYFDHPWKETNSDHPLRQGAGVAKLEKLQWKQVLEGDYEENGMGYPLNNYPVNMVVNAFRRFQSNKYGYRYRRYLGYEIQDRGTGPILPNGKGSSMGNSKHPGLVTVNYGGRELKFKLNVISPLTTNKGFYSSLEGPDAPSNAENSAPFFLHGVKDQAASEHDKYKLNYFWMDRLGNVKHKTISMKDIIDAQEHGNMTWSQWFWHIFSNHNPVFGQAFSMESDFELQRPAYSWVTATYRRTPQSDSVIVAGKELNQIFLMFCGIKTLNDVKFPEGKGHGGKIWLEDYRSRSYGEFDQPRSFGLTTKYTNKYIKTYVLQKGDKATFTTFDGDPHRLDNDEEEWYLSNRSMAKRVKSNLLWNTTDPSRSYLKYYIGSEGSTSLTEITSGRSGKDLMYTFNTPGTYDMRVVYRGGSDLYVKIKVLDTNEYPNVAAHNPIGGINLEGGPTQAKITTRNLTQQEKKWLGYIGSSTIYAYEVQEVKTTYQFKEGYRSYQFETLGDKLANRWSKYNDYADNYSWYVQGNQGYPWASADYNLVENGATITGSGIRLKVENFINNYESKMNDPNHTWMWKDWANHYSSVWKGKLKPANDTSLDGLPPYTPESTVTRLYDLGDLDTNFKSYIDSEIFGSGKYPDRRSAPWQYVIPLVSTTKYHGYRQRTNPSCIYDLSRVFNDTNGAFTGNPPNPADPNSIQAPETFDIDKDMQDFYYNLKYHRILISEPLSGNLRVYQSLDNNGVLNRKFVAMKSSASALGRDLSEKMEDELDEKKASKNGLYPNQSNGLITLTFTDQWVEEPGNIDILVHDHAGRVVFNDQFDATREIFLNLSHLKTGLYLIKRSKGGVSFSEKILIAK